MSDCLCDHPDYASGVGPCPEHDTDRRPDLWRDGFWLGEA